MQHRPFVILDVETTGGSARYSRITEIGALRIEAGKVVGTYKQLINPGEHVPAFITRITGITNEMVWDAPTFRSIADDFELFLSDALFIAHNVNFDYSFIKMEFERLGNRFNMDRACSVRLSRKLYPDAVGHSLDKVIERLGVTVTNRHRAFDDAEVIWKMMQKEYDENPLRLIGHLDRVTTVARKVQ